jgi:hypothetical protein
VVEFAFFAIQSKHFSMRSGGLSSRSKTTCCQRPSIAPPR